MVRQYYMYISLFNNAKIFGQIPDEPWWQSSWANQMRSD